VEITEKVIKEKFENRKIKGKTFDDESLEVDDVKDFEIIDCTFTHDKGDMLVLKNCKDVTVKDCTFKGKDKKGNFIHIKGEESFENRIVHCTFKDHTFNGTNGGEAIIIGLAEYTGCRFKTVVKDCTFNNCSGDPELISIKSCENEIEGNTIKNWKRGNITIRNGGFNKILNNTFIGDGGGIRVFGDGNRIIGNHHKDNDNTEKKRRPLIIGNGDRETDKHFKDGKPLEKPKKGDGKYDGYAQAKNNIIEDNIFENCKGTAVIWGLEGNPEKPIGNKFRKNTLIADRVESKFLEFHDGAEDKKEKNTFENNKMKGDEAKRGDLPKEAID
jgi:poly(beta-D-mannuronate) lyase